MPSKPKPRKATLSLSISHQTKDFLDQLANDGYNRSSLVVKMIDVLEIMYHDCPQVNLPRGIDRLKELIADGLLLRELEAGNLNPKKQRDKNKRPTSEEA